MERPPKVYKVKDPAPNNKFKGLHPHLPSPPSLLLIIGSVKQGKTNLLVNLCCSPEMFKDRFEETYIISNSLNADPKGEILKKFFICEDHYEDRMIEDIIERQKKDKKNIAIFLDDILTKDFSRNNYISFLSTRFRHHGVSMLCFLTQSFRSISGLIRGNATDVIIMKQQSNKELEKIIEEYGQFFGDTEFRNAYNEVMKEPYSFIYAKLSENPAQLFRRFEERLI